MLSPRPARIRRCQPSLRALAASPCNQPMRALFTRPCGQPCTYRTPPSNPPGQACGHPLNIRPAHQHVVFSALSPRTSADHARSTSPFGPTAYLACPAYALCLRVPTAYSIVSFVPEIPQPLHLRRLGPPLLTVRLAYDQSPTSRSTRLTPHRLASTPHFKV